MKFVILCLSVLVFVGCGSKSSKEAGSLSAADQHFCDSLKIDRSIVSELRKYSSAEVEPFHYSLSRQINADGSELELDPIYLPGLVFNETAENTENIISNLRVSYKSKGYSIFIVDENFGIGDKPDVMAILKTTDKFEILRQIKTDGINYDIDNDSLIQIIQTFDAKYNLELVGASGDWCEFIIGKEPVDWMTLANEVYAVCPDVVDQGTGDIDALAAEMKKVKRLYLWWD